MEKQKVNPYTVALSIFIFVIGVCIGVFWLHKFDSEKRPHSPSMSDMQIGEKKQIRDNNWPGCVDKDVIDKLNDYAHQHDEKAFNSLLGTNLLTGQCRMFKKGESVYVTDLSMMGYVKIRPQGETQEYWILKQALK